MKLNEIAPFVRQALTVSIDSSDNFASTCLQAADYRLFYMLSERGTMVIEGTHHMLHRGGVILLPPGTKYSWQIEPKEPVHCMVIHFDYTQNFTHLRQSLHTIPSSVFKPSDILEIVHFEDAQILNAPVVIDSFPPLEQPMRLVVTEFYLESQMRDIFLASQLQAMLIHIVKVKSNTQTQLASRSFRLAQMVIEYIQMHYMKPLSNETIGKEFHIHPVHLNRIFKQYTGNSLHEFLLQYRLNVAMTELRESDMLVFEVAASVGFSDHVHFNRVFKKYTGVTPGQYRAGRTNTR